MKLSIRLFSLLLILSLLFCKGYGQEGKTFACEQNGKFGIRDKTTKKWIIPAKYTWIDNFSENGLARVYVGGDLETKGEITIEKTFHPVVSGGKWGFINTKGKMVIKPQYDFTTGFDQSGVALVNNGITFIEDPEENSWCYCFISEKQGKWGAINADGKTVLPVRFDNLKILSNRYIHTDQDTLVKVDKRELVFNHVTLYDLNGNTVLSGAYEEIELDENQKDQCFIYEIGKGWGTYSLDQRTIIIPPAYPDKPVFKNGLLRTQDKATQKYGYINKNLEWAIEPLYPECTEFSDGYALIANDTTRISWAVIDTFGNKTCEKIQADIRFSAILFDYEFHEGLMAFVDRTSNLAGFIDVKGAVVIQPVYGGILQHFKNGKAEIKMEKKYAEEDEKDDWDNNGGEDDWGSADAYYIDVLGKRVK